VLHSRDAAATSKPSGHNSEALRWPTLYRHTANRQRAHDGRGFARPGCHGVGRRAARQVGRSPHPRTPQRHSRSAGRPVAALTDAAAAQPVGRSAGRRTHGRRSGTAGHVRSQCRSVACPRGAPRGRDIRHQPRQHHGQRIFSQRVGLSADTVRRGRRAISVYFGHPSGSGSTIEILCVVIPVIADITAHNNDSPFRASLFCPFCPAGLDELEPHEPSRAEVSGLNSACPARVADLGGAIFTETPGRGTSQVGCALTWSDTID
jgi:hypothetical protein